MSDIVIWLYLFQLFFMGMSVANLCFGIWTFLTGGEPVVASKMVVYGMFYGLFSLILGMTSLSLLK